jgi:hypothetical protein
MRQDDAEYHGRVARWIRAYGRRAGQIDAGAVRKFAEGLRAEIDKAERAAIHDLRDQGFSWAEIGRDYGMTRQSAWERWGKDDR